ncbi:hypothetical protein ACH5RR_009365 [Cinchona calisaya]|uniref:Uncharacterized protein n=1 Tax=Cinchona calisaya TaxID=153742 RepID=A0ABD3AID3_9GENT
MKETHKRKNDAAKGSTSGSGTSLLVLGIGKKLNPFEVDESPNGEFARRKFREFIKRENPANVVLTGYYHLTNELAGIIRELELKVKDLEGQAIR